MSKRFKNLIKASLYYSKKEIIDKRFKNESENKAPEPNRAHFPSKIIKSNPIITHKWQKTL
jgi:hypothetical protein